MRYCGSLDLDHLLRQPFAELGRLVRDRQSGSPLPPVEVATRAVLLRAAGYEVMPMCAHHDHRGFCLGHADQPIGM
ncbi:hypothetical protein [Ralstonia mannitolilytica]|uniref:Uncharacterized protein n=1 Tax=Ralstonia mannitolilytica TaxID=105219 RepID=A0AAD2B0H9_9RALS|nr:hypothetical protein [Ralstonia mannitolilytica]ATG18656.1 hypothetical protein CO705_01625 [Ralstonia pickettii]ANA33204.1 hypothetical protein VZ52_07165 [Ralstonia mannitolilytica]MBY4720860.1 hypothetical protein [Ralstonia mannitolilytica]CAJ0695569.1 hypothetical protein R82526_04345 [Ralstonia mannitolilytica]CAJ0697475.1 hypothetical protein R77591_04796 [Ralstonia mannitolilytica]